MKLAIVTCNIGDIDEVIPPVDQKLPCDYYCFTEENIPAPMPHLSNRLKGKFIKTQLHRFLPGYEGYIWLDGRVEITSPLFSFYISNKLKEFDMVAPIHYERKNVFDEIDYITHFMRKGSAYLIRRYWDEPWEAEFEFYRRERMPHTADYYSAAFWGVVNNAAMNKIFDSWWHLTLLYSQLDQTQLNYVIQKSNPKISPLKYYDNGFVKVGEHKNRMI